MPHPFDWLDESLADLDRRGLRRMLSENASRQRAPTIEVAGQSLVNFGSNDYLGLASDPRIAAAAKSAADQYGWGAGASPLVTGRSDLHARLERALADFQAAEAALLFPTGYAANVGAITALVGKGDVIYSDALNHASIIDGCRLSGATIRIYPNNFAAATRDDDLVKLREMLQQGGQYRRRLIVTDAVFSMHGTYAPLMGLAHLASKFEAMLMVDEAHAIGVVGEHGAGLCDTADGGNRVDVRVGTLSKALGGHGGFVAGSRKLIDWLSNRARPYIFSTAAPPVVAAAGLAALEIVRTEPERRQSLDKKAVELRRQLIDLGLIQPTSLTHIVPIFLRDPERALAAAAELCRRGFFVPAIRPPSVPHGQSLLRISLTYSHIDDQISSLVSALGEIVK